LIENNDYLVAEVSSLFGTKSVTDDQDGDQDGTVEVNAPLTLTLQPFTFDTVLLGLGGNATSGPLEGVMVYSADNNTIYFLGDYNYSPGDVVTLVENPLTSCFAAGTQIATPFGEVAVETLEIGQPILRADGTETAVKWVGRQAMRPAFCGLHMQPVRFKAGSLGQGLPQSDLTVTADHGMVLDGLVINASALVNGDTIDFVPYSELPDKMTVYHIETENHDIVLANGAAAETYLDVSTRADFDNYQEYLDVYGADRIIREMDMQRISASRLVPAHIKRRLGIQDRKPLLLAA